MRSASKKSPDPSVAPVKRAERLSVREARARPKERYVELVRIIEKLWRHRLLVSAGSVLATLAALATAYHLTLLPPTMTPRSIEFGSASTQVLIDADTSPLLDLSAQLEPLSSRAEIYARLVESNEVRAAIAREAGITAEEIVIEGRGGELGARSTREPGAEQRANQLRGEAQSNRVLVVAEQGLPVVSIYTQSATAEAAIVLAEAAADGLVSYLTDLQSARRVPERRKVAFRALGEAEGGMVNSGASKVVAVMAFLSVMGLWMVFVLMITGVREGLQESKRRRESADEPHLREAEGGAPRPEAGEPADPQLALDENDAVFDFERRQRVG
jgi:hypothetical protein